MWDRDSKSFFSHVPTHLSHDFIEKILPYYSLVSPFRNQLHFEFCVIDLFVYPHLKPNSILNFTANSVLSRTLNLILTVTLPLTQH